MPDTSLPLCEDSNALVPEILAEWRAFAAAEPRMTLPEEQRYDSLADVVRGLVDAALCQSNDRTAYRTMIGAAAKHGADRGTQGFAHDLLFTEFYILREAIWRVVQRRYSSAAGFAVLRIDNAITTATRASLLGYHRGQLEEMGRWGEVLDQLADESPLVRVN